VTAFPDLADLVAPVEVGQFLDSVLGGSFRRFPGGDGRFAHLVPWAELDRVLRQHRLEFPRLRLALDGDVVPAHEYTEMVPTRRTGLVPRLRSARLSETLRAGATLVLDSVQEMFDEVGELAARLEHGLRERVQVNLYAGWGKTHGFDVHWDDHDALILQLSGRKRWRMYGVTRPAPLQRDVTLPPRPHGDPVADFLLCDGDVLYLPRGQWHDVSALGEESLHLTIGFNRATGVDLVSWLADQLRADELFRSDLPRFATAEQRRERAAALRAGLLRLLDDDTVDRFLTDRDVQAPTHPRPGLPWSATADLLPADDNIEVRLLAPRAVLTREEGAVVLAAGGRRLTFAEAAEPVLAALLPGLPRSISDLVGAVPSLDRGTVRSLLGELIEQGLIGAR
jgi:ribosomal protein L16 Arg81 hydroxylase